MKKVVISIMFLLISTQAVFCFSRDYYEGFVHGSIISATNLIYFFKSSKADGIPQEVGLKLVNLLTISPFCDWSIGQGEDVYNYEKFQSWLRGKSDIANEGIEAQILYYFRYRNEINGEKECGKHIFDSLHPN